jgi:hypothetical protein
VNGSPSRFFGPGNVGPVPFGDRALYLTYWFTLPAGSRFHVLFERARPSPRQGLRVRCRSKRDTLQVAGQRGNQFDLWPDTAPPHVEIEVPAGRVAREIGVMNVWELPEYGTTMQGVNAACIAVREVRPGEILLECSDGYGAGEPEFDDLVARLILEPRP